MTAAKKTARKKTAKKAPARNPTHTVILAEPFADPVTRCGAKARKGGLCRQPAGFRTDHAGQGKCYLHGGATPIKHGRYSSIQHDRIRDLIEHHEGDPDPLNILPELAAARALFVDFIERYQENTDAMLAWHASFEATRVPLPEEKVMAFEHVVDEWEIAMREGAGEPTERQLADVQAARAFVNILRGKGAGGTTKPRTVLDISDAYRIVGEVTKIAERIEKVRAANAISRKDLNRLVEQMGKAVMRHVAEPETLRKIRHDWLELAV